MSAVFGPAGVLGRLSGRTSRRRAKAQDMRTTIKPFCVAGSLAVIVCAIILADCSHSFGNHRQRVAAPGESGSATTLSANPTGTREEWLSAIHRHVERYRKKGPQSRAPRDLLTAGEAYVKAYRTWQRREDLDSCIRLMGEFTRVERRGPDFIAGLTILKEAHLLKRKTEKSPSVASCPPTAPERSSTPRVRSAMEREVRAGDGKPPQVASRGPSASAQSRGQSGSGERLKHAALSQRPANVAGYSEGKPLATPARPGQTPDARQTGNAAGTGDNQAPGVTPEPREENAGSSSYRYTGNPFCAEDRDQNALPLTYLVPERSAAPEAPPPPRVVQPRPAETTAPKAPPLPPPLPPTQVKPDPPIRSASLPPSTASDAAPQAVLAPRMSREFVVVLDPGHGGKDPGAVSSDGSVKEKDIALEVATRVKQRLASCKSAIRVELTRSDDRFLALEERTALANAANADLFISIHCNADIDASSKGVETFYLSKATSRRAMRVAARENGISLGKMTDVEATLLDLLLTSKKCESDKLANVVHTSLLSAMRPLIPTLRDRGVKPAPFYVLLGAQMPAILVECAFISNARDRVQLTSPAFLDSVATGIAEGAVTYIGGLEAQK